MMGHRSPGVYVSSEPLYVAPKTPLVAPKPSAQIPQDGAIANRVVIPTTSAPDSAKSDDDAAALPENNPAASAPAVKPQLVAQTISTSAAPAQVTPATDSSSAVMVQIAAVKSRPDAEALAAALRQNGFQPTVRTEAQDKLIHVQIGPFNSRDEAKTMRQKLSSAGYNAFIK
jgi:DedD protein